MNAPILIAVIWLMTGQPSAAAPPETFRKQPLEGSYSKSPPRAAGRGERRLVFASSTAAYEARALDGIYAAFFGSSPGGKTQIEFEGGSAAGQRNLGRGLHVGLRFSQPLAWQAYHANIAVGYDRQTYVAPDGLGPFKETMTLKLEGLLLNADVERRWLLPVKRHREVRLAAGVSVAHYWARLTSPLLDVRSQGWAHDSYIRGSLVFPLIGPADPSGAMIETSLTGYGAGGLDLAFGLSLAF